MTAFLLYVAFCIELATFPGWNSSLRPNTAGMGSSDLCDPDCSSSRRRENG